MLVHWNDVPWSFVVFLGHFCSLAQARSGEFLGTAYKILTIDKVDSFLNTDFSVTRQATKSLLSDKSNSPHISIICAVFVRICGRQQSGLK